MDDSAKSGWLPADDEEGCWCWTLLAPVAAPPGSVPGGALLGLARIFGALTGGAFGMPIFEPALDLVLDDLVGPPAMMVRGGPPPP